MDSHESKIRRGQAFNLAVNDAISAENQNNPKYIFQQYLYYYNLADILQSNDLNMVQEVLDKPDFNEAVEQLRKTME